MKQKLIHRSFLKKVGRVGLLLGIKESYLFSKNSLGLIVHPFRTLRSLQREKDRSQQLLFLGLPILVLMIGLIFSWWILIIVSFFLFGYLGYWVIKTWRIK